MSIISAKNVVFQYDDKKALDDISFDIRQGSVVALVGPNGAGKTTLLRCMVGLEKPLSGSIHMQGIDVTDNPRAAHRKCGYLSDDFGVYEQLTVRQSLTYMAWCQAIAPDQIAPRIVQLSQRLGIDDKLDMQGGSLSRGNRQRLGIALSLIHDPEILILDEPASGLDPEARARLSSLMLQLKMLGKTIIVSSHILNELEDYCTEMLVIRDGRVGDHVVLKEYNRKPLGDVRITIAGDMAAAKAGLSQMAAVSNVRADAQDDRGIIFETDNTPENHVRLLSELTGAGIGVMSYAPVGKKLADAYMDLAERPAAQKERPAAQKERPAAKKEGV